MDKYLFLYLIGEDIYQLFYWVFHHAIHLQLLLVTQIILVIYLETQM